MDVPDFARAEWRKSSYSDGHTNCVEVALTERATALRDSKNPTGLVLTVGADAWHALCSATLR